MNEQSKPSAAHDPVGTVRRCITNWGFSHFIKLDQGQTLPGLEGSPCWECYDAYGSMAGLDPNGAFLSDQQMDEKANTEVVYVPMDDEQWARIHGLAVGEDRTEENIV